MPDDPGATALAFARAVGDALTFRDAGMAVGRGSPRGVLSAPTEPRMREFLSGVL